MPALPPLSPRMEQELNNKPSLDSMLAQHRVFRHLPAHARSMLSRTAALQDISADTRIADADDLPNHLFWVVAGEVALLDDHGELLLLLGPDELFGMGIGGLAGVGAACARGEAVLIRIDATTVRELIQESPGLAFFLGSAGQPPTTVGAERDPALNLMTTQVRSLVKHEPITMAPERSIREAAELMSQRGVSSVLLVRDGQLAGLVTDRDLRNRVLATGLDSARPVDDIATHALMTIDQHSPAFDALLLMARHNIHHVPVVDGQRLTGMITATDLSQQNSTSAVHLAGEIRKQNSVEGLQTAAAKVARLQQSLGGAHASAYSTGHIITAITDAVTIRLIQLAQAQLGPAPIDFVWVAAGSQARNEQTARSDQDNGLVLADDYDEAAHGEYFKALARFVCDGLNTCGYVYCPGEMMAMTDTWRLPRKRWIERFTDWTSHPDPTALMLTCVFFDMRAVHGNASLLDDVRHQVHQQTRGNTIFLAHMAGNALLREPPLGLFKGIATIRSGEHKGTVDLKHHGVVPIIDMARIYALASGDAEVNTHDRLRAAAANGLLNENNARDLQDALEFIGFLRLQHQTRQLAAGQPPDNHLHPSELSNFEQTQLKDAFQVVQTMQKGLAHRYQAGRF